MELRSLPLSRRYFRSQAEAFLGRFGLRLEALDYYAGLYDGDEMVGGGGYAGNTIKCVAVDDTRRGEGLTNTLISHLISRLRGEGIGNIFLFTKPENEDIFHDLSFWPVGRTGEAILLESRKGGIQSFCNSLEPYRQNGVCGGVVVNANPFTLGHLYLLEQARRRCDHLYVFVVEEDRSAVPFLHRKRLVAEGTRHLDNLTVLDGGPYIISSATFPTYFLKEDSDTASVHARLDIDIFGRHISPALNITLRFAGEEPADPATARYNQAMLELLPKAGIEPVILPRRTGHNGTLISASTVRRLAAENQWSELEAMVPATTLAFLKSPEGLSLFP